MVHLSDQRAWYLTSRVNGFTSAWYKFLVSVTSAIVSDPSASRRCHGRIAPMLQQLSCVFKSFLYMLSCTFFVILTPSLFIGFTFALLGSNLVSGSAAYWCRQGHIASALCPWSSVASSYTTEHFLDRLYIRFQRCSTKNIVEYSANNLLLLFSSKLSALSGHLINHDDNGA